MQSSDKLESYMLRMDLPHEPIAGSENTWLVAPENLRHSAIVVRAEDPIVVFTAPCPPGPSDVAVEVAAVQPHEAATRSTFSGASPAFR